MSTSTTLPPYTPLPSDVPPPYTPGFAAQSEGHGSDESSHPRVEADHSQYAPAPTILNQDVSETVCLNFYFIHLLLF